MIGTDVITESARKSPIIDTADLVVVGGGPAGLAAAVSAAEAGLETIIIEKNGYFGGASVSGMSGTICGLFDSPSDGSENRQIVFGFADRMYSELKRRDGIVERFPFGGSALAPFVPMHWKAAADTFAAAAKVRIWFHTYFAGVAFNGDDLAAVLVENKEGRGAITGRMFIDASGDGNVAFRCGVDYSFGRNGEVQAPSAVFRMTGIDWSAVLALSQQKVEELVRTAHDSGEYNLPRKHVFLFPQPHPEEGMMNVTRVLRPDGSSVNAGKVRELSDAESVGRAQIAEYARFLRNCVPGFANARIIETAAELGIRQTRTIRGKYRLKTDDVAQCRKFDRGIVRSAWPVEVHEPSGTRIKILYDDYYEIPYDVMVPDGPSAPDNLLVAGRCISAEHEALASARVTAQCMEEGMAAGLAARLSVDDGCKIGQVDVQRLRARQRDLGAAI